MVYLHITDTDSVITLCMQVVAGGGRFQGVVVPARESMMRPVDRSVVIRKALDMAGRRPRLMYQIPRNSITPVACSR